MAQAAFSGQINQVGWRQAVAAAGQYFIATNPTPGTGVQYALQTSFSATANGLFTISNNSPAGAGAGGKTIQLDQLVLMMTGTAPTATTAMKLQVYTESGIVAPSAGNVAVTARNVNPAGPASYAVVNSYSAGAATIPAAVGTRTLTGGQINIPTSLGITGDTYTVLFGGDPPLINGSTAVRGTAAAALVVSAPAVTLPPQYTAIIDMYWLTAATTAPTFEYTLGWLEY